MMTSYNCVICKDVGVIQNPESKRFRFCECRELKKYQDIIKRSEISEAYQNYTFGNFDVRDNAILQDAKYIAIKYVKEFNKITQQKNHSILFMGQPGSGKTHLSIAIANNLMKKMTPVLYMPYRDVITHLKQIITDDINYQREIAKYKTAAVLLIDDLYKGKITTSDHNIMFEIINYRYLKKLPLIISTEKMIDDILEYDEAIGSRIIEMSKGRLIEIKGKNLNHRLG